MASPDKMGTDTLSSISNERASTTVATTAPKSAAFSSRGGCKFRLETAIATRTVPKRQPSEPSKDLFRNLCRPNLRPIRAAKVSPTIIKARAAMATGLLYKATVNRPTEVYKSHR